MAFKFIVLCAFLAAANAGNVLFENTAHLTGYAVANPSVDAIGATQQNVVRSFGGTVSQYSKAVDTPYSSVRKTDTRINNNVYTPAVAKTLTYAAQAPALAYAGPAQALTYAAPAQVVKYAAPAQALTYAAPAQVVKYAAPAPVLKYAAPTVYSQQVSPVAVAGHAIAYSPAAAVAHVTFDGFGAHYGY